MRFADRRQAGRELADLIFTARVVPHDPRPLVLALPRGGVPVADEVATALRAPLDVLVVRKIGAPGQPEFGVGAVVGDDPPYYDQATLRMLGTTAGRMAPQAERERAELRRREELYRGGRPAPEVNGRTVLLVDDGLATGVTATAALRHLRAAGAARTVLAVPVAAPDTAEAITAETDELVCVDRPSGFVAVGRWYDDFEQVTDGEVTDTLARYRI